MATLKEVRSYRPFKSSDEYLIAMKEDLAEWLNMLYPELDMGVDCFMERLDTGVVLCKHANSVRDKAEEYVAKREARRLLSQSQLMSTSTLAAVAYPILERDRLQYRSSAAPGTFVARDNVSIFIAWCRHALGVMECLLFETDDLILRKNEKNVILCLLDVARRGSKFGMLAPMLVQLEREIDREIAAEQRALQRANSVDQSGELTDEEEDLEEQEAFVQYGPVPQIVTNDLKSLDEMVRDLVERCRCPVQFPMIRVSEGKYRIGDTKVLIFVRVLRNHVMVRVGGGWDTLSHYLDKHDPCRCKTAHRSPLSAKLILKATGSLELDTAQVLYERSPPRTRRSSASSASSGNGRDYLPTPSNLPAAPRSRSPTPRRSLRTHGGDSGPNSRAQSRSPTPQHRRGNSHNLSSGRTTPTTGKMRSRSPSPRYQHRQQTNLSSGRTTPTTGKMRSRSPSPRLPGRQLISSGRSTPTADTKTRSRSTTPNTAKSASRKSSNIADPSVNNNINNNNNNMSDQHGGDSGSEVSDEGYRSLGHTVNTTSPPLVVQPDESLRIMMGPGDGHPDVADKENLEDRSTRGQSESPVRRASGPAILTRSRSASNGDLLDSGSRGSWSSRQGGGKSRPALAPNTFLNSGRNPAPFGRNSFQRSSLGACSSSHSTPTKSPRRVHKTSLPSSLQTSPTKQISPLLEQILQVKDLSSDTKLLHKMKEIIRHYSDIVDLKLDEERKHEEPELDFTTEWVRCNGGPSPRKDSKMEGAVSKIPGPVCYRPASALQ